MLDEYKEDREFINKGLKAINSAKKTRNNAGARLFYQQFFLRYHEYIDNLLYKFGIPHDLKDDIRDDFLVALWSDSDNKLRNYKGESSFKTYLYVVLRYFVSDWRRYHGITESQELPGEDILANFPTEQSNEVELAAGEQELLKQRSAIEHAVAKTLLQLSFFYPGDARILIMELCGKERKEIAAIMGDKENTLTKKITRKPYGIYARFEKLFKGILRKDYGIDVDDIHWNYFYK